MEKISDYMIHCSGLGEDDTDLYGIDKLNLK